MMKYVFDSVELTPKLLLQKDAVNLAIPHFAPSLLLHSPPYTVGSILSMVGSTSNPSYAQALTISR